MTSPSRIDDPTQPTRKGQKETAAAVSQRQLSPADLESGLLHGAGSAAPVADKRPLPSAVQIVPAALDVLTVGAGAVILWIGAEGRGVMQVSMGGVSIFLGLLTLLLTFRNLISRSLLADGQGELPAGYRWSVVVRNCLLVSASLYSVYLNNYMIQWVLVFAAVLALGTGIAGFVLGLVTRSGFVKDRFMDIGAGLMGLAFTSAVHGWDSIFLCFVGALTMIPAFIAWSISETLKMK